MIHLPRRGPPSVRSVQQPGGNTTGATARNWILTNAICCPALAGATDVIRSIEEARIHHAARRRGGSLRFLAPGGAGAASREADHWSACPRYASEPRPLVRCDRAAIARARLGRGPHHLGRVPLGGGARRATS